MEICILCSRMILLISCFNLMFFSFHQYTASSSTNRPIVSFYLHSSPVSFRNILVSFSLHSWPLYSSFNCQLIIYPFSKCKVFPNRRNFLSIESFCHFLRQLARIRLLLQHVGFFFLLTADQCLSPFTNSFSLAASRGAVQYLSPFSNSFPLAASRGAVQDWPTAATTGDSITLDLQPSRITLTSLSSVVTTECFSIWICSFIEPWFLDVDLFMV